MSISTTLIAGHKIIIAPENTHDVSKVIGRASLDVGALCGAGGSYVNKFAKYKPVIRNGVLDTTSQLNSDKTWKSSATWWRADDGKCGMTVTKRTTGTALVSNWDSEWAYSPPTGGTNAPYRLTDFNYYDHNAAHLVSVFTTDTYYVNQADGLLIQFQFFSGNPYQLLLTDFINQNDGNGGLFPYTADHHIYCGALVAYGQSTYSTCTKAWATSPDWVGKSSATGGAWQRTVTIPKTQMPQSNTPYVTVYPFISATTYNSSTSSTTDAAWEGGVIALPVLPIQLTAVQSSISGVISSATCTYSMNALSLTFTYTITAYGNFQADYVDPKVYVLDADRDTSGQYSDYSKIQAYHIISYEDGYGWTGGSGYPLNLGNGNTQSFNQNTVLGRTGTASLTIGCDAVTYVTQYKQKHGTTKAYMRICVEMGKDGGYYTQTIFDNNGQGLEISGSY